MPQFDETPDRLLYRNRDTWPLALAATGLSLGLLGLLKTQEGFDAWILWLLLLGAVACGLPMVYEPSEYRFDPVARCVKSGCQTLHPEQTVDTPFSDLQGVRVERRTGAVSGARYRIALMTSSGPVPLEAAYRRVSPVLQDAQRLHAWLQAQGVAVPLHVAGLQPQLELA